MARNSISTSGEFHISIHTGVSQELGVPVGVVEDQHRFILHHCIMWRGGDVDHAIPLIDEARRRFPELRACSFDRGFHSSANQLELGGMLDECALPKKGYLSAEASAHQSQPWFRSARQSHPAVESAINHLEHCGLVRDQERKRLARQQRLRAA